MCVLIFHPAMAVITVCWKLVQTGHNTPIYIKAFHKKNGLRRNNLALLATFSTYFKKNDTGTQRDSVNRNIAFHPLLLGLTA